MTEILTQAQINSYQDNGYLVLENHLPSGIVKNIRHEIKRFEEESRELSESNERLELEVGHTADQPRIRRIRLPHTTSDVMRDLMYSDHILAPARDLIGPDLRLHTTKLNMKSAENGAVVEWHQDYAFYPHTNDDILAIGVIIDDMQSQNGPLMVYPGSHKGPVFDSDRSRRILFYEMMAADAFPIVGSLTQWHGIEDYNTRMLCGKPTLTPRLKDIPIRIPQPQPDVPISIYEIQKG